MVAPSLSLLRGIRPLAMDYGIGMTVISRSS